jgi:hypothetical protein
MKKTTTTTVFVSAYIGLFLAGVLAFAVDAYHHLQFYYIHGYGIHGWDNCMLWLQFGVGYGLMGFPFVLIGSFIVARIINLFAKGSHDV